MGKPATRSKAREPGRSETPKDAKKSADPKQVGERGNIQQNTSNRRHQQKREER